MEILFYSPLKVQIQEFLLQYHFRKPTQQNFDTIVEELAVNPNFTNIHEALLTNIFTRWLPRAHEHNRLKIFHSKYNKIPLKIEGFAHFPSINIPNRILEDDFNLRFFHDLCEMKLLDN